MFIRNCLTNFFKQACMCMALMLTLTLSASAQQTIDYKVHANIIYRFTKYIEWPENKEEDFVIGVVGDSPLYEELSGLTANKSVGDQKIRIKRFAANAGVYNCRMLFVSQEESSFLKRIALLTDGMPILLITEDVGLAKKGSCINFVIVDDRLKLEINKNKIQTRGLNIASELLKLATLVN